MIQTFKIAITSLIALSACSPSAEVTPTTKASPSAAATVEAESGDDLDIANNVTYCFQRVGQVGSEPKRGEACDVHGGGSGSRMEGLARPQRNHAMLHISSPSLEAIGVKSTSFILNRGSGVPKFNTGVHVMDQVRLTDEEKKPKDLPDRIASVSDITGANSMFSWTSPDAAHLRNRAPEYDFTGYEIASAVLAIDTAVDLDVEDEQMAGMTFGRQNVEGTLTLSLIPMGGTGEQFGPTVFEFGTTIEWGLIK